MAVDDLATEGDRSSAVMVLATLHIDFLSFRRKVCNYLRHVGVEKWYISLYFSNHIANSTSKYPPYLIWCMSCAYCWIPYQEKQDAVCLWHPFEHLYEPCRGLVPYGRQACSGPILYMRQWWLNSWTLIYVIGPRLVYKCMRFAICGTAVSLVRASNHKAITIPE